jgi:hypothetical protein
VIFSSVFDEKILALSVTVQRRNTPGTALLRRAGDAQIDAMHKMFAASA